MCRKMTVFWFLDKNAFFTFWTLFYNVQKFTLWILVLMKKDSFLQSWRKLCKEEALVFYDKNMKSCKVQFLVLTQKSLKYVNFKNNYGNITFQRTSCTYIIRHLVIDCWNKFKNYQFEIRLTILFEVFNIILFSNC
jgi:hypothetical protein